MKYDVTITITKGHEEGEAARAYVTRTAIELEKGKPFIEAALKAETYNRSGSQCTHLDNQYCCVDLKTLTISASGSLQDEAIKSFVKTVYERAKELKRLQENIGLISNALPSGEEK